MCLLMQRPTKPRHTYKKHHGVPTRHQSTRFTGHCSGIGCRLHLPALRVWLTEYYFTDDSVYNDALLFAAAMRTERIRIGFAVLQMPFHHPVRLAVQLCLLDNLSNGRIGVGIGKSTVYNEYEFVGHGMRRGDSRERLEEAQNTLFCRSALRRRYQGRSRRCRCRCRRSSRRSCVAAIIPAGLPVWIELLGRPSGEPLLLGLGLAYEQATHHRHPRVCVPALRSS